MNTITRSIHLRSLAVIRSTHLLTILGCAVLAAFSLPVHAVPGDLDLTFGGTGIVVTDIGGGSDIGDSVAIQNDGKIVVAGH